MLNGLKNRGVKDVLFFCADGLPGFKEAIQAVYPQAEIQRCVIPVYNAPNETAALSELENVKEK